MNSYLGALHLPVTYKFCYISNNNRKQKTSEIISWLAPTYTTRLRLACTFGLNQVKIQERVCGRQRTL